MTCIRTRLRAHAPSPSGFVALLQMRLCPRFPCSPGSSRGPPDRGRHETAQQP